jgi:hypothetical protein
VYEYEYSGNRVIPRLPSMTLMNLSYISPHSKMWFQLAAASCSEQKSLTNDLHCQLGPIIRTRAHVLDLPEREHAVDDFAEHDVLPVKEITLGRRNEKLHDRQPRVIAVERTRNAPGIHSSWVPSWPSRGGQVRYASPRSSRPC